jgi:hypothetical protein
MARVDRVDENDAVMQPEYASSFTIELEY